MELSDVGKRVKLRLAELSWTQRRLGEKVKMTPAQLSQVLRAANPRGPTIHRLAEALDVSTEYLLTGTNEEKKED